MIKTGSWKDNGAIVNVAEVGETISYTFTVTNTGNVTLTNVTLTDADARVTIFGTLASLTPGVVDALSFTGSYTITQADIDAGNFSNTATVCGTPPPGALPDPACGSDTATVPLPQVAGIELIKTGAWQDNGTIANVAEVNETISYTFTVKNSGNVTLTNVDVTDPRLTALTGGPITLAVDASDSITFTGSYTITQADIDAGSFPQYRYGLRYTAARRTARSRLRFRRWNRTAAAGSRD